LRFAGSFDVDEERYGVQTFMISFPRKKHHEWAKVVGPDDSKTSAVTWMSTRSSSKP
jgi:hypothetical protein